MGVYFLIGFIYCMINVVVRKDMNEEGDWLLTIAWWILWPVFFIPLILKRFIND